MKLYVLTICSLFWITSALNAQKGLPAPGKIDKADLEMTDCDFDKGAEAVKLIDWGSIYYDRGTSGISQIKTVFEKRVRIKILKEKGLSYADVKLPYYAQFDNERILKLEAYTYNLDESGKIKVTEVSKSSIYSKKINSRISEMIITFPEAKVGSVIEYKYRMERETADIMDWYFQSRIPTRYSEYQIRIPHFFHFTTQPTIVDKLDVKEEIFPESISLDEGFIQTQVLKKNFIMRNLMGIRDEPFMGSARDYQQRLEFQLSEIDLGEGRVIELRKNWKDIVKALMKREDFGQQLEKSPEGTDRLVTAALALPDKEAKMKYIFEAVRKNIQWDGDEDIYTSEGISRSWSTKTGGSADINLLLITLLNRSGVKAAPILFSTREHGLINSRYPFVNQFNTVMAFVQLNDKFFVLDATDRFSNYKLMPSSIVNTRGFIIEGESGIWKDAVDHKRKYKLMAALRGEIDAAGLMKGDGVVNSIDYARKERVSSWVKDKEQFRQEFFTKPNTAIKIDELLVNNTEADDLPFEQKVKFSTSLNSSGDYRYFNVNLFSDLDKNMFLADERQTDIDFGFQKEYMIFGNYTIPQGYIFEELPKNMSMIMPDTSIIFNRFLQAEDNLLNVRITVEYRRTFYSAANYEEFKEFHKKLFAILNEQVVIKKKATP